MLASALVGGGGGLSHLKSKMQSHLLMKQDHVMLEWNHEILAVLEQIQLLGASCATLLRDLAHCVRDDEKRLKKVSTLEKQFAFQGAVVIILPWGAVALTNHFSWNIPTLIGFIFQLMGALLFSAMVRRMRKADHGEVSLLRNLMMAVWIRTRAGLSLAESLRAVILAGQRTSASLQTVPGSIQFKDKFKHQFLDQFNAQWRQWFQSLERASEEPALIWLRNYPESNFLAQALEPLMLQGAPTASFLGYHLQYLEELRHTEWEQKLVMMPSYLSLLFCGFFAPSAFFLLLGSLWDQIAPLLM